MGDFGFFCGPPRVRAEDKTQFGQICRNHKHQEYNGRRGVFVLTHKDERQMK